MDEREAALWLSTLYQLSPPEKAALIDIYGSAYELYDTASAGKIPDEAGQRIKGVLESCAKGFSAQEVYRKLYKFNADFVAFSDDGFPEKLKSIKIPPIGLFYKGRLPDEQAPAVSVIGARACSDYGKEITAMLVRELASCGIQVISGLAAGIDGLSHRAALDCGGDTFGVLGFGFDKVYPRCNADLFEIMGEKGGIITEYFMGAYAEKRHFPERNRLIAGLADAVIVIEARKHSGTIITVDRALEQGKDVFVVPGRIGDCLSEGCLELIKQGAGIITDVNDLAGVFKDKYPDYIKYERNNDCNYRFVDKNERDELLKTLSQNEKKVYRLLGIKPVHIDYLAIKSELDFFAVLESVSPLIEKNLAAEASPEYYVRKTV